MTPTRPLIAAAIVLTIGGLLAGMAAAAIAIASLAVRAGLLVQPADGLLVDDLVAVLPFIVAFVALDLATARGLATGRAWAVASGLVLALGAVAMGTLGLLILVLGTDPLLVTGAARAFGRDGIGIAAAFIALNLAALIALWVDGLPFGQVRRAAA